MACLPGPPCRTRQACHWPRRLSVTNQKSSPSLAACAGPSFNASIFPVPCLQAVRHLAQASPRHFSSVERRDSPGKRVLRFLGRGGSVVEQTVLRLDHRADPRQRTRSTSPSPGWNPLCRLTRDLGMLIVFAGAICAMVWSNGAFPQRSSLGQGSEEPFCGENRAAEIGGQIYAVNCAKCHGPQGQGAGDARR